MLVAKEGAKTRGILTTGTKLRKTAKNRKICEVTPRIFCLTSINSVPDVFATGFEEVVTGPLFRSHSLISYAPI